MILALFLTWAVPTHQVIGQDVVPLEPESILGYQVYRRPLADFPTDLERVAFVEVPSYDDGTGGWGFCWRVQAVLVNYTHGYTTPENCVDSCHP